MAVNFYDITSCISCPVRRVCGGLRDAQGDALSCQFVCGGSCRDNSRRECVFACPNNPARYYRELLEVRALDYLPQLQIGIPEFWHFPFYVPQFHHGYRRKQSFAAPAGFAAIAIADILKHARHAANPAELRDIFRLARRTHIIATGIARDDLLESWWHDFPAAELLRRVNVVAVTVPNFSIFDDAPRHQNMINIARLHHFEERLTREQLPVVPHIYAQNPEDWARWSKFLTGQHQIRMVAAEFQTGLQSPAEGRPYIQKLGELQRQIRRPLHLLAIGGAQYIPELSAVFPSLTVIDSQPFMKTMYRRALNVIPPLDGKWIRHETLEGEPLDRLFEDNYIRYVQRVEARRSTPAQSLFLAA